MTLREELVGGGGTTCKLCAFLLTRPAAEQREWAEVLAEPVTVIGNVAAIRALRKRGLTVSDKTLQRHRAGHPTRTRRKP